MMVIGDYQYGGRSILWVNREELSSHCKCGQRRQMLSSNSFHLFGPNLLFFGQNIGTCNFLQPPYIQWWHTLHFQVKSFYLFETFFLLWVLVLYQNEYLSCFLLDFPFLIDLFVCGVRFVWEKLGSVLIQETCVGFSTATTPGTRQVWYLY